MIVINKAKRHKGDILLINASKEFAKGRPKNYLTENINKILDAYGLKEIEGFSKIITIEARRNDYNLTSRYVSLDEKEEFLSVDDISVELAKVDDERKEVDGELRENLQKI